MLPLTSPATLRLLLFDADEGNVTAAFPNAAMVLPGVAVAAAAASAAAGGGAAVRSGKGSRRTPSSERKPTLGPSEKREQEAPGVTIWVGDGTESTTWTKPQSLWSLSIREARIAVAGPD